MGFKLVIDKTVAAKNVGGGGRIEKYIGVCSINQAVLSKTANGNNVVDLHLETETGGKAVIFGLCVDPKWSSGAENFDYPLWQKLALVARMETGDTKPTTVKRKSGEVQAEEFTELSGKKIVLAMSLEYDWYNGNETDKMKLRNVFYPSKQTVAEKATDKVAKTYTELEETLDVYRTPAWVAASKNKCDRGEEAEEKEVNDGDDEYFY